MPGISSSTSLFWNPVLSSLAIIRINTKHTDTLLIKTETTKHNGQKKKRKKEKKRHRRWSSSCRLGSTLQMSAWCLWIRHQIELDQSPCRASCPSLALLHQYSHHQTNCGCYFFRQKSQNPARQTCCPKKKWKLHQHFVTKPDSASWAS